MIEVSMMLGGGELAHVRIENMDDALANPEYGDYSIQFAVHTGEGVAMYQRSVYNFPRKQFNALALLKIALETLTEKELTLDLDPDARGSSNLARRLPRTL